MIIAERLKFNSNKFIFYKFKKNKIYKEIQKIVKTKNFEEKNCVICNKKRFEIINELDRYGFYYPTGICKNCGMVQQSSYYNEIFLKKFYSEYYNFFYSHFKNPEERFHSQYESAKKSYNYVKQFLHNKNSNILEIGCGAGGILKYYNNMGYDTKGLDYDDDQLNYGISQGLDLENLNKYSSQNKYDLVILSHVLEHMSEPEREIKKAKEFLKENGYLYIEVPSIHSIKNLNYNYNIKNFFHIAHYLHFSLNSFTNFMNKNRLKIIKINDEIQCVAAKLFDEKIEIKSSYKTDLIELKNIENYYQKNKIKLFIKKYIFRIKYNLIIFIKKIIPKRFILIIKKILITK